MESCSTWLEAHYGVIMTASVILMSFSFRSIASSAPRTLSATSAAPRGHCHDGETVTDAKWQGA
jgi:hypothetical protein